MAFPWRFIPPNAVTCVSIVMGLLSVSHAVRGDHEAAAWFILWCMLLDKADGTVARLLKASSRFGLELDSLADLIAFGVAPGVLVLCLLASPGDSAAHALERTAGFRTFVYVGSFFFVIAAALRLAKFNVVSDSYGKGYFFGIPSTAAGAFIATYYLTATKYGLPREVIQAIPGVMLVLGLLMVSRVPLPKFAMRKSMLINALMVINMVLIYVVSILRIFPEYLLSIGTIYLVFGSGWALIKGVRPPAAEETSE